MEYKSFKLEITEVKQVGSIGTFKAILNKYNIVDLGNDRVLPSFGLRNDNKIVPLLKQHKPGSEHGVLKLIDTGSEMLVEGELFLELIENTTLPVFPVAHETYSLLKRGQSGGVPVEFSMGYIVFDYSYMSENGKTIRNINDGEILEGSRVTFAMNPESVQLDVKGGVTVGTVPEKKEEKAGFLEILNGREARRKMYSILEAFNDSVYDTLNAGCTAEEKKSSIGKSVDDFAAIFKNTANSYIDSMPNGKEFQKIEIKNIEVEEKEINDTKSIEELYNILKGGK